VWIEPLPGAPWAYWWSKRGPVGREHQVVTGRSVQAQDRYWTKLEWFSQGGGTADGLYGRFFCLKIVEHQGQRVRTVSGGLPAVAHCSISVRM
jgi:hypothetical protein